MIMGRCLTGRPRGVDPAAHFDDGVGQADEDRLAHQEVADVEFGHLRDGGDRRDGLVVDAVPGVDFEAERRRLRRACAERRRAIAPASSASPSRAASQKAPVCSSTTSAPVRLAASICSGSAPMKSETRLPLSRSFSTNGAIQLWPLRDVEPAFGRALFAPLRHEAHGVRAMLQRDLQHLRRHRHFEIQRPAALAQHGGRGVRCRRRRCGGDLRANAR